jgi:hypothetical protein
VFIFLVCCQLSVLYFDSVGFSYLTKINYCMVPTSFAKGVVDFIRSNFMIIVFEVVVFYLLFNQCQVALGNRKK